MIHNRRWWRGNEGFKNTSRSGSDQIWLVFLFFSSRDLSATGSISTKTHLVTSVVLVVG